MAEAKYFHDVIGRRAFRASVVTTGTTSCSQLAPSRRQACNWPFVWKRPGCFTQSRLGVWASSHSSEA